MAAGPPVWNRSLAYGALAGSVAGPFLINAIGAGEDWNGIPAIFRYEESGDSRMVVAFVPLMLGVSLVTADDWILRYFASGGVGRHHAAELCQAPVCGSIAVIGQATGQASLPFFSSCLARRRLTICALSSPVRLSRAGVSFLAGGWMMAVAVPLMIWSIAADVSAFPIPETTVFFFWFSISLALWSARPVARAFYAPATR